MAQTEMPLYPEGIPNAKEHINLETRYYRASGANKILIIEKVSWPTLTAYLPDSAKATGQAVVICPGGGYWVLAASHEGSDVARVLNDAGIAAFVLKYRLPSDATMQDKTIGPLQDAQKAILWVRSHADSLHVKSDEIGIMGFSAGGHLASTASTHFEKSYIDNPNHISVRPDFSVLGYPVISFEDSICHRGSRENLIGKNPSRDLIHSFSNEEMITDATPAAFLVHAKNDNVVPVANTQVYAKNLKKHGIPAEVFLYEEGGHGFGLINPTSDRSWIRSCIAWIKEGKWKH